jgi:hypothetical protein
MGTEIECGAVKADTGNVLPFATQVGQGPVWSHS